MGADDFRNELVALADCYEDAVMDNENLWEELRIIRGEHRIALEQLDKGRNRIKELEYMIECMNKNMESDV